MAADQRPWRLIHGVGDGLEAADGATNMALDSALLEGVKAGGDPVLRLYRWSPATLSFGRNQPAQGRYDADAARDLGIDFVRRPTGGQAVLHDQELTYAVIAPVAVLGKPRAAYRLINRALVAGLRQLGLDARLAGDGPVTEAGSPADMDWAAACFRRPERGEVVVGGAKLVGSAQRLEQRTVLQHGSILVGGTQAPAEALLLTPARVAPEGGDAPWPASAPSIRAGAPGADHQPNPEPLRTPAPGGRPGWTTVEQELGARPSPESLAAAVLAGFDAVLGVAPEERAPTASEWRALGALVTHYRSEEWTWRR